MYNVTILTPCRDASSQLDGYRRRIETLEHPYADLRVVMVEGDSVDDTWVELVAWAMLDSRVRVVQCDMGKPRYGSVVNAERFQILATVFNAGLAAVDLAWSTHVLMLPVDIGYQPDLLARLLAHDVDIVSPFVWQDGVFFDTWAFSRGGRQFVNFPRSLHREGPLLEMDTVGGTLLMSAAVVQSGCRYTPQEVDRGLCKMAKMQGFRLWADPATHAEHLSR